MDLKKYQRYILSVVSGVILSLGWTEWSLGIFLLVGFIPLLAVEEFLYRHKDIYKSINVFWYSYLVFFTWNTISTWWIYNSTLFGVLVAVLFNSLFMATVFLAYHRTKIKLGEKAGYISLIVNWIAFEYLHLNWELSWPWLTLGNGFANNTSLIQWYEYTGILGGSLWVLAVNILLYLAIRDLITGRSLKSFISKLKVPAIVLFVPLIISFIIYLTYTEEKHPYNIIVIQPNIDPYNEKFGSIPVEEQLNKLLNLSTPYLNTNTDFIIAPETALSDPVDEGNIEAYPGIRILRNFVNNHPSSHIIIGMSSYRIFENVKEIPRAARKFDKENSFYVSYNAAICLDTSKKIQIYHKSQLVLGVEKMPYPKTLGFLEKLSINLGGTSGSLGSQDDRTNFYSKRLKLKFTPVICYESIYGDFLTSYVRNGANLLFIITNDGWWGNTAGYRQHLNLARLRAIETRRSIARSANTGISCFIDQRGNIIKKTSWWQPCAISTTLNANSKITFYSIAGDYLGIISSYLTLIIVLFIISKLTINFIRRKN